MEILIGTDLLAALGSPDAEDAVEEFASRHGESLKQAAEILEGGVQNWENDHRAPVGYPNWVVEPLTVDALLSEASEGMTEASAYDEEARENY